MGIVYDVFGGDAAGGPVDYSAPLLTTATLSAALPAQAPGTRTRYGVRARDTVTGLSDGNTDAAVLVVVGADGSDQTAAPHPPAGLRAFGGPGGTATVEWSWPYPGVPRPLGFNVYVGTPTPAYSGPAVVVPYAAGRAAQAAFTAGIGGLADGVTYQVAVRAYNATGEEPNTATVAVVGRSAPPPNLGSLTATLAY